MPVLRAAPDPVHQTSGSLLSLLSCGFDGRGGGKVPAGQQLLQAGLGPIDAG